MTRLFIESRSIPRNKNIVRIFHEFGLIEQWGSGFQRILAACNENGNPKPLLKEVAGAFVIVFYKNEGINEGINKLYEYIKSHPGNRLNQISDQISFPHKTIERWLKILKGNKKIEYRGSKKTGGYFSL